MPVIKVMFSLCLLIVFSLNKGHALDSMVSDSDMRVRAVELQPEAIESDALLTDWEGQHWASLDADEDKVALSWTADEKRITFQVIYIACHLLRIDRAPQIIVSKMMMEAVKKFDNVQLLSRQKTHRQPAMVQINLRVRDLNAKGGTFFRLNPHERIEAKRPFL